ncbi:Processing alpha glucosidase I [Pseudocyphellaria aurata]|nr:Processing alpha glucosidase I [Pseudocyphellaria aurata]
MIRLQYFSAFAAALFLLLSSFGEASDAFAENAKLSNESLLWGPYRPNLYFGVRPRIPKSLTTGLLWARVDSFDSVQNNFRHTCEQHEGMHGYGWDEYDVRYGGRQIIHDAGNSLDITTEFVKIPGGQHGGSWGVRIKGRPREDAPERLMTTMIFYAAMEGFGSLSVKNEPNELGVEGSVTLDGSSGELGSFTLEVTEGPGSNRHPPPNHPSYAAKPLDRTMVASLQVPEEQLWQAKPLLFTNLKKEIDAMVAKHGAENAPPPWQTFTIANEIQEGNLHFVQKVFEGAFEFDVLYSSSSAEDPISSHGLTNAIKTSVKSFSDRFSKLLAPQAPFDKSKYQAFSRSMFSNLLGGIGYFYGDAVVDKSYAPEYEEENEGFWEETAEARGRSGVHKLEGPLELYTSIPSRPFFPRGFLWDEGFHLLPVADWDIDLTLEIVRSWFTLTDEDGWIGREQILGPEARSKVPVEFQVQYPHYANPPTLFLVFEALIDKLNDKSALKSTSDPLERIRSAHLQHPELAISYLKDLYPLLRRHYFWYRTSQRGDIKSYDRVAFSQKEAYRWRGRTPQHILTSGLDDYPRPQPPHPGELHTDLISWMGMMTRSMRRVAEIISESEDAEEFKRYETAIIRNIDDLHWSQKHQTYCDATIDDYEESVHVCHKGYISIFPFLTGLVAADSPRLGPILDLIGDPEELWSDYGLRSLSLKDEFYGTEENYWRSPVWININYLAVKSLLDVATISSSPHQIKAAKLYTSLRTNLVRTVFDEWERTGFAWEQYNPETGMGQRTQHFTGWTSLVVKIMCMPDLKKEEHGEL